MVAVPTMGMARRVDLARMALKTVRMAAPTLRLSSEELKDLLTSCVRPSMSNTHASAIASALLDGLGGRYLPLRESALEACGALFTALGQNASPSCDTLLKSMAGMWDVTLGSARPVLLATLGHAAKALGPERFIAIQPCASPRMEARTLHGCSPLRHHIGNAKLAFFGSYFIPLTQWLEERAKLMETEQREIEARNIRNKYEQVWALLPGLRRARATLRRPYRRLRV